MVFVASIGLSLFGYGQNKPADEVNDEPCVLFLKAIQENPTFTNQLQEVCGGKIVLLDHGFDWSCLQTSDLIVLQGKSEVSAFSTKYISVFSIHAENEIITLEYIVHGVEGDSNIIQINL